MLTEQLRRIQVPTVLQTTKYTITVPPEHCHPFAFSFRSPDSVHENLGPRFQHNIEPHEKLAFNIRHLEAGVPSPRPWRPHRLVS